MSTDNPDNTYCFTSDTHFGHNNIIKYCNRPFADGLEMDRGLIANWNAVCDYNSIVFHLGDFGLGRPSSIANIVPQLQFAHLHVIKGNHDKSFCEWYRQNGPANVTLHNSYLETWIEGTDFTLCHYAMLTWNKSHHGALHLYGHSHGTLPDDPNSNSFDIGVDCHNYKPLTLPQVRQIMATKQHKSPDKHGTYKTR